MPPDPAITAPDATPPGAACEQASRDAEAAFALPPGLLLAIGRVESGHFSARLGRVAPWPWAVDFAGTGILYSSPAQAAQAVGAAEAAGQRNIDVGCFQVNLGAHPDAFPDLRTALDPAANARFAAAFLSRLHARFGDWAAAAAAYHSETAALAGPYLLAVMQSWAGAAGSAPAAPAPDRTWVVATPVRGMHVVAPGGAVLAAAGGMRIVTPAAPPAASSALPAVRYGPLPRPAVSLSAPWGRKGSG